MQLELSTQTKVENVKRKNYKDRRDYCFFCEKDVSHYARHLIMCHNKEVEVRKILSYKNGSKQKRAAISNLKKRGNFIRNKTSDCIRPVKRLQKNTHFDASEFVPCKYCLGFYKKQFMYRHTKKCSENADTGERQTSRRNKRNIAVAKLETRQPEKNEKAVCKRQNNQQRSWSVQHKKVIYTYFADHILGKIPPKKKEVDALIEVHPDLFGHKKWSIIKAVVCNMYTGRLKY